MSDAKKSSNKNLKDDIDASVKFFDVAQPGKTAAPTTSRPVIVGHKATTKRDPMVVESSENEEQSEKEPQITRTKPLTIKPIESQEPQPAQEQEKAEAPELAEEKPKEQDPEIEEPAPEPEVEPSPSAAVEALAKDVTADQSDKKEKHDLEAINEEAEKLIASKQFFVPISQDYKSGSRLGFGLFLCLILVVLVLVGLNFAIDAELIDVGVSPLTDVL